MKHQVCVVSGTRADYGLLRPLLIRLRDCPEIELTLAATGSHLSAAFGGTGVELTRDGFAYDSVPFPLDDDSKAGMARATGAALSAFADYFSAHRPDLLVVLGDRYEILAAVIAAHFSGIPIAHISGGGRCHPPQRHQNEHAAFSRLRAVPQADHPNGGVPGAGVQRGGAGR